MAKENGKEKKIKNIYGDLKSAKTSLDKAIKSLSGIKRGKS